MTPDDKTSASTATPTPRERGVKIVRTKEQDEVLKKIDADIAVSAAKLFAPDGAERVQSGTTFIGTRHLVSCRRCSTEFEVKWVEAP